MTTEGGFRAASAVLLAGLMLLAGLATRASAQEGTGHGAAPRGEPWHAASAERARSASVDLGRHIGHVELNGTETNEHTTLSRKYGRPCVRVQHVVRPLLVWVA
jgi:hypothetical protein